MLCPAAFDPLSAQKGTAVSLLPGDRWDLIVRSDSCCESLWTFAAVRIIGFFICSTRQRGAIISSRNLRLAEE